ncbi:protocadherin-10-like [Lethenteron reissneri]|uniref:protocadherin-10-like n=1 Tax=Lethenteron reissneri TaxID=7753 RepID=UPI002AB63EB5|nr:protocadherin-10-like [Lethenteron reissneri]
MSPLLSLLLLLLLPVPSAAQRGALRFSVREEEPPGTVIARLADLFLEQQRDGDDRDGEEGSEAGAAAAGAAPSRFVVMDARGADLPLGVHGRDGTLSVARALDREALCPRADPGPVAAASAAACVISMDVAAEFEEPRAAFRLVRVHVEVLDVNDHAPEFPRAVIPVEVSESAPVGTRFPLDAARDPDVGENARIEYSLAPSQHFRLEVGAAGPGQGALAELVVTRALDREERALHELRLTARDAGATPRAGTALVRVSVLDTNDNSPAWARAAWEAEVREDAAAGSTVARLSASDPDEGPSGEVVYSLSAHAGPDARRLFRVDASTGLVTLARALDREQRASHTVHVQASDLGPHAVPAHSLLTVRVIDVNDNEPALRVRVLAERVSEAAPRGTLVAHVTAWDADAGDDGRVSVELLEEGGGGGSAARGFLALVARDADGAAASAAGGAGGGGGAAFVLLTDRALDRERAEEINVTVVARDHGSPPRSSSRSFTLRIADENDNAPAFPRAVLDASVPENARPGTLVASVTARDADAAHNARVSYALLSTHGDEHEDDVTELLRVDPATGAVRTLRPLDREEHALLTFRVRAQDSGTPPLASDVTVHVRVLDANDNAPAIDVGATRSLAVPVGAPAGHPVGTVRARDPDEGLNGAVELSVAGESPLSIFELSPGTGQLRTRVPVPRSALGVHALVVVATDSGEPRLSTTATVSVTVMLQEEMERRGGGAAGAAHGVAYSAALGSLGTACALLVLALAVAAARRGVKSAFRRDEERGGEEEEEEEGEEEGASDSSSRALHAERGAGRGSLGSLGLSSSCSSSSSSADAAPLERTAHPEYLSVGDAAPRPLEVSQLLALLHQGEYHPRPSFKGNARTRSFRSLPTEPDQLSSRDSARGDSDTGGSGSEGRASPCALGGTCTAECRVLGHSDSCWLPATDAPYPRGGSPPLVDAAPPPPALNNLRGGPPPHAACSTLPPRCERWLAGPRGGGAASGADLRSLDAPPRKLFPRGADEAASAPRLP